MKTKGRQGSLYFVDRTKPPPKHSGPKILSERRFERMRESISTYRTIDTQEKLKDHPMVKKWTDSLWKRANKSRGKHYTPTSRINMK